MFRISTASRLRRVPFQLMDSFVVRSFAVDIVSNYKENVVNGKLKYDENQYKMLNLFQKLMKHIHAEGQPMEAELTQQLAESSAANGTAKAPAGGTPPRLRGIYLYGEVGTGKTMVMDIFHDAIELKQKKRIHFHDFMLEVHRRIHQHKQLLLESKSKVTLFKNFFSKDKSANTIEPDPIKFVAQEISKDARVLCFDEFQVTDICDAMILNKLFHELWERNTLLVATSNRPPEDLYKNGLNREYFVPFIHRLNNECIVKNMNIKVDYRQKMTIVKPSYLIPNTKDNYDRLWDKFVADVIMHRSYDKEHRPATTAVAVAATEPSRAEGGSSTSKSKSAYNTAPSATIPVMMGRTLTLTHAYFPPLEAAPATTDASTTTTAPAAAPALVSTSPPPVSARGIAWMDFTSLCETEVGAADYIALCSFVHSIYIYGIPRLSVIGHNEARRFITLFDELYNANVRVQWTADAVPSEIFMSSTAEEVKQSIEQKGSSGWYNRGAATDDKASPKETAVGTSTTAAAAAVPGAGGEGSANSSSSGSSAAAGESSQSSAVNEPAPDGVKKYSRNNDQRKFILFKQLNFLSCIFAAKITVTVDNGNGGQEDMKALESELTSIQDLRFAFKRAASRMNEMSSIEYYEKWKAKYHIKVEKDVE